MPTKLDETFAAYEAASKTLGRAVNLLIDKGFITDVDVARRKEWQRSLATAALGFMHAIGDLAVTGLDMYLTAASKDRASAERDRASAERDRASAERDRAMMNRFTMAIMVAAIVSAVATGWGAFRRPTPIVIPTPVVNITGPSAPPPIVIPAPVVNVTTAAAGPKRRSP
jgi:cell division protein FtsL